MKKQSIIVTIWKTTWPLVIYAGLQSVVTYVCCIMMVWIDKEQFVDHMHHWALVFILIAALISIPIYYRMIRKDRVQAGEERRPLPMDNKDYAAVILSGATLAFAANSIINLTPLPIWFSGYEEVNETIYEGNLILQILGPGMFCCAVEELSSRGITYLRAKRSWGKRAAMIYSAFIFGIFHMNVVQAVYAFVLGLFFAWVYERYQTLWASIIAHMSANLFILFLSSNAEIEGLFQNLVGYCLGTCISVLVFYYGWRYMKLSDLRVELEFVEKEPDTLKGLTAEYQEQERRED